MMRGKTETMIAAAVLALGILTGAVPAVVCALAALLFSVWKWREEEKEEKRDE